MPSVLGQRIVLDGRGYEIAGVMPASFETPLVPAVDVWLSGDRGLPRTFPFSGDLASVRDSHIIFVIGRLAPGVSREAAQRELGAMMVTLAERYPQTNAGLGVNVKALHEEVVGDVRGLMLLLQLAVGLMLLIACANVAHLLLGQLAGRQSEMITRTALGAGRGRLVRQLVAETLVLAIPGGAIGLLFAWGGLGLLIAAAPPESAAGSRGGARSCRARRSRWPRRSRQRRSSAWGLRSRSRGSSRWRIRSPRCARPATAASTAGTKRSSSPSLRWRRCCSSARAFCWRAS